ncbi:MAG: dTMP kinase [Desulfuromonas sp.]|nr:MAG: dTMP kinase [Desulfuromonas sp.]
MTSFITFEGIEGSGKSTQVRLLADWIKSRFGEEPVLTREPGGCRISDQIRATLLDAANKGMDERAELLLYAAARAQHMAEIIQPALSTGKFVICDRFTDATLAYQGYGRGLSKELIEELNTLATCGVEPDLTFLLDFPPETGISRARSRNADSDGPNEDRFEQEEIAFHHRVRNGYLDLEKSAPRIHRIDATGSIEEVAARIRTVFSQFIEQRQAI